MHLSLRMSLYIPLCILALYGTQQAYAAKETSTQAIAHGKVLVQKYCTRCHSDEIYTRPDHKVKSLAGLNKQVQNCKNNVGIPLFDEDVNDIVKYLNATYYKFSP